MGISAKLLGADERVVLHLRTHAKALILPALALVLLGALVGVGTALIPTSYRPAGQIVVAGLILVPLIWWVVIPFLRWRNRTYTITNYRLITREGVLHKTGKDLPLIRINDVSFSRSLMDRLLGCGTLNVQTAAEGAIVLDDVPDVEQVHVTLTELLFGPARQRPAEHREPLGQGPTGLGSPFVGQPRPDRRSRGRGRRAKALPQGQRR